MGFVYNNVWEAFCKTYLELNGFFVLTNTFVALMDEDEQDRRRRRLEADIIAYKLPRTDLGDYLVDVAPDTPEQYSAEFFAGTNRTNNLVYCEVKANLSGEQGIISDLLDDDNTGRKADLIRGRFKVRPQVVVMAYEISQENKERIAEAGWTYKEFPAILRFIRERFDRHRSTKRPIQYNDPWLEMVRFFSVLRLHGVGTLPE
jgi:hypothetical protein